MIPHAMAAPGALVVPTAPPTDGPANDPTDGLAADTDPGDGWPTTVAPTRSATMITVVSGCGGAGGSTLAAMMTIAAAQAHRRAALVDADPMGAGIAHTLTTVLPTAAGMAGDMAGGEVTVRSGTGRDEVRTPVEELRPALTQLLHGHDLVVVDCPRYWFVATAEALDTADLTLVVVPARGDAVLAAHRVRSWVTDWAARVEVVVRDPRDGDLSSDRIAETLRLTLAGEILTPHAGLNARSRGDTNGPPRDPEATLLGVARRLVDRALTGPGR